MVCTKTLKKLELISIQCDSLHVFLKPINTEQYLLITLLKNKFLFTYSILKHIIYITVVRIENS